MGIKDMLRPGASTLAERVRVLEAEMAKLTAEHDQAEAAAVDLSIDETKYPAAAEKAAEIRTQCFELGKRLERLRTAHAAKFREEQAALIGRLKDELREAEAASRESAAKLKKDVQEAAAYHEKAVRDAADEALANTARIAKLKQELYWARADIPESEIDEIEKLKAQRKGLGTKLHESGLEDRKRAADAEYSRLCGVEHTLGREEFNRRGLREELGRALATRDALDSELAAEGKKIAELTAQIEALVN